MSSAAAAARLGGELVAIAGAENVVEEPAALALLAIDGVAPRVAVAPGTVEEVAAVLRMAAEQDLVVVPLGGGTRQSLGSLPERVDIVLCTTRLKGIEFYDPGDLTIGVGAGATVGEVQSRLAQHGQLLPLDVARREVSTIGGALAAAAHGPLKHGYGGARDFCIGVKFVTGDGKIAKGGGRVVKNVAGYDLMKLMIGSQGTLGVMVSANFKVFPAPRQTRTFVLKFLLGNGAIQFRNRLLRAPLTPMCMELVSPRAAEMLGTSGLAADNAWNLLVRAAGSDAVMARYRAELGGATYVKEEFEGESEARTWAAVADFETAVVERAANAMLINVSVPLDWVAEALKSGEQVASEHGFLAAVVGRVGAGSLVWAFVPVGAEPVAAMQFANSVSALRAALPPGASAVVTRCPLEAKRHFSVWGDSPNDLAVMRAVKRAMDPAGVLNRGRFVV